MSNPERESNPIDESANERLQDISAALLGDENLSAHNVQLLRDLIHAPDLDARIEILQSQQPVPGETEEDRLLVEVIRDIESNKTIDPIEWEVLQEVMDKLFPPRAMAEITKELQTLGVFTNTPDRLAIERLINQGSYDVAHATLRNKSEQLKLSINSPAYKAIGELHRAIGNQ